MGGSFGAKTLTGMADLTARVVLWDLEVGNAWALFHSFTHQAMITLWHLLCDPLFRSGLSWQCVGSYCELASLGGTLILFKLSALYQRSQMCTQIITNSNSNSQLCISAAKCVHNHQQYIKLSALYQCSQMCTQITNNSNSNSQLCISAAKCVHKSPTTAPL